MINIPVIRFSFRFFKTTAIGIAAGLIASAIMNIYYYFQFRKVGAAHDLKVWVITGGCIGIILGIIYNILFLPKRSSGRDMQSISLSFVRLVIIALSATVISMTVWYYYRVDYFPLKDNGPLALIVGLLFGMWDLLSQTSSRTAER